MIILMLLCYISGLSSLEEVHIGYKLVAWLMIGFNIFCFLYTLLANSGIPKELFSSGQMET